MIYKTTENTRRCNNALKKEYAYKNKNEEQNQMKTYVIRLNPGDDLKESIHEHVRRNKITAGYIVTCVGSLKKAVLRLADERLKTYEETFEIVSLVGTVSQDGVHLHMSLADATGNVIGGHVKEGCIVYTTAEIVLGQEEGMKFTREYDKETGFKELKIR